MMFEVSAFEDPQFVIIITIMISRFFQMSLFAYNVMEGPSLKYISLLISSL